MRASLRNRVGPATRSCSRRRFSATPGVDGASTLHHARYSGHLNESPRIRSRQSDRTGSRLAYNQPNGSVGRRTRTTPPPIGHALPFRDQGRRPPRLHGATLRCSPHRALGRRRGRPGGREPGAAGGRRRRCPGVDRTPGRCGVLVTGEKSMSARDGQPDGPCATSWSACGGRRRTWRRRGTKGSRRGRRKTEPVQRAGVSEPPANELRTVTDTLQYGQCCTFRRFQDRLGSRLMFEHSRPYVTSAVRFRPS